MNKESLTQLSNSRFHASASCACLLACFRERLLQWHPSSRVRRPCCRQSILRHLRRVRPSILGRPPAVHRDLWHRIDQRVVGRKAAGDAGLVDTGPARMRLAGGIVEKGEHQGTVDRIGLGSAAVGRGRRMADSLPGRAGSRPEQVGRSHRLVGIAVGRRSSFVRPELAVADIRAVDSHPVPVVGNIAGLAQANRTDLEEE